MRCGSARRCRCGSTFCGQPIAPNYCRAPPTTRPDWRRRNHTMDAAYISALAALAGSAIGGLTSFATSWTTQQAQARAQRIAAEREGRAALFGRFLDEAARLYADALQNRRDEVTALMNIYALTNR